MHYKNYPHGTPCVKRIECDGKLTSHHTQICFLCRKKMKLKREQVKPKRRVGAEKGGLWWLSGSRST